MSCPCGSGATVDGCCGPYIRGDATPPTAEALMRSRYSAYELGEIDYIVETHDPQTRDELDPEATREWADQAEWLGLEVVDVDGGTEQDDVGEVEFVARYRADGTVRAHHERSTFRRRSGRWYFCEGVLKTPRPVVRAQPKVGRNAPCPCGSGNKYKKCCGRA